MSYASSLTPDLSAGARVRSQTRQPLANLCTAETLDGECAVYAYYMIVKKYSRQFYPFSEIKVKEGAGRKRFYGQSMEGRWEELRPGKNATIFFYP